MSSQAIKTIFNPLLLLIFSVSILTACGAGGAGDETQDDTNTLPKIVSTVPNITENVPVDGVVSITFDKQGNRA